MGGHGDEGEATAAIGDAVVDEIHGYHLAGLGKVLGELRRGHRVREVPNIQPPGLFRRLLRHRCLTILRISISIIGLRIRRCCCNHGVLGTAAEGEERGEGEGSD